MLSYFVNLYTYTRPGLDQVLWRSVPFFFWLLLMSLLFRLPTIISSYVRSTVTIVEVGCMGLKSLIESIILCAHSLPWISTRGVIRLVSGAAPVLMHSASSEPSSGMFLTNITFRGWDPFMLCSSFSVRAMLADVSEYEVLATFPRDTSTCVYPKPVDSLLKTGPLMSLSLISTCWLRLLTWSLFSIC